jgi:hypothetical protein
MTLPLQEVQRQANNILGLLAKRYESFTQEGRARVCKEMEITLVPDVKGIDFNPRHRCFVWAEPVHKEEFRMRAAADMEGIVARGRITAFLGSIILADVPINVRIDKAAPAAEENGQISEEGAKAYKRIFASYSHKDGSIVDQFSVYAKAVGDEFLMDLTHLRSGERWSERLQEMIQEANVFQLFWSSNSMRSQFVKREWEYAISLNRPGFIRPTYWEEPFPCSPVDNLPPEELRRLHFERVRFEHVLHSERKPVGFDNAPSEAVNPRVDYHGTRLKGMASTFTWLVVAICVVVVAWVVLKL